MLCVASELCRSNERFTFSVRLFIGGALFICADTIENVWEVPMSGSSSNKPKGNMNKIVSGVTAVTSLITLAKPVADTIQDYTSKTMEERKRLISVPELYSKEYPLSIEQAVELLNNYGLKSTLVKTSIDDADVKYRKCFASQVISTKPKGKQKVEPGTMILVKYITQEVIDESQKIFEELEARKNESALQKKNKHLEREQKTKELMQNARSKVQKVFQKSKEDNNEQKEE